MGIRWEGSGLRLLRSTTLIHDGIEYLLRSEVFKHLFTLVAYLLSLADLLSLVDVSFRVSFSLDKDQNHEDWNVLWFLLEK